MKFFRDLFTGLGNERYELARVGAAWAILSYSGVFIGVFARGVQVIDFTALGVGYAAVLAGAGGLIWAKDTARTAAVSQGTKDATDAAVLGVPASAPTAAPATGDGP